MILTGNGKMNNISTSSNKMRGHEEDRGNQAKRAKKEEGAAGDGDDGDNGSSRQQLEAVGLAPV